MAENARALLDRIRALPLHGPVRVMNVCGGHERTIAMAGLRRALPKEIELIAGPGCPVCVCPEEDVHAAIALALRPGVILAAFGDMLRVPANGPKGEPRSLEAARAADGEVRPIASPREAVALARAEPGREVVFFAAGFETTTAPIAAMIAEGVPENLSILLAARRTWPAVAMLLDSEEAGFEALIAPGHVSAVMGPEEWRFVPQQYGIAAAVSGFETEGFLAGLHAVLRQRLEGRAVLDNCYGVVVRPGGNPTARRLLDECFDVVDANWRGIGIIPRSGFALKPELERLDAVRRFGIDREAARKRAGEMPPGCDCARVVLGKIHPEQCVLYGKACTPRSPVGPCMVSDEGACRIRWGERQHADA
jgi:hydrogenase expression/formation protein HypD